MKKLVIPKEMTQVREFASMFVPGKPGKKNKYLNRGLVGRNVRPGVYRFVRADGKQLKVIVVFVQVSKPWCDEETWTLARTCSTHGHMCPCESEECNVQDGPNQG